MYCISENFNAPWGSDPGLRVCVPEMAATEMFWPFFFVFCFGRTRVVLLRVDPLARLPAWARCPPRLHLGGSRFQFRIWRDQTKPAYLTEKDVISVGEILEVTTKNMPKNEHSVTEEPFATQAPSKSMSAP